MRISDWSSDVCSSDLLSGQVMLVKNKGMDIAILRTMGATRGMILRIFFATGAAIGVVGTALGFVIGLSFAANIEAIRQWLQGLLEMELFTAEIYFLSSMRAEERRVGKELSVRVDLGGRRIIKKKTHILYQIN